MSSPTSETSSITKRGKSSILSPSTPISQHSSTSSNTRISNAPLKTPSSPSPTNVSATLSSSQSPASSLTASISATQAVASAASPSSQITTTTTTLIAENVAKEIFNFERPEVVHKDIPPYIIRFLAPVYFSGKFAGIYIVPFIIGLFLFLTGYVHRLIGFIIMLLSIFGIYQRIDQLLQQKMETSAKDLPHLFKDQPSITTLPTYKDMKLIKQAWCISPFRRAYLRQAYYAGKLSRETAFSAVSELDRQALRVRSNYKLNIPQISSSSPFQTYRHINDVVVYQPIEGYCSQATANTIQLSIPKHPISPFDVIPKPCSLLDFERTFTPATNNSTGQKIRNIQPLSADGEKMTLRQFTELILSSIDPRNRFAVNFLRGPMFSPNPQTNLQKMWFLLGGHWSPIGGYAFHEETQSLHILVLDVNNKYGPFMVPIKRLYEACHSRDDKGFRGLVMVELEPDKL